MNSVQRYTGKGNFAPNPEQTDENSVSTAISGPSPLHFEDERILLQRIATSPTNGAVEVTARLLETLGEINDQQSAIPALCAMLQAWISLPSLNLNEIGSKASLLAVTRVISFLERIRDDYEVYQIETEALEEQAGEGEADA